MSELKIIGKIDLNQFSREKKQSINLEKSFNTLNRELSRISSELSAVYGDFVEESGNIKMIGRDEDLHKKIVQTKEELYGKKKGFPQLAELAISVFLDRAIGDRFVVTRSSKYDDYEHGVDNVLLDKKTGFVVCGFDQVLGMGDDDGASKKKDKVDRINKKGGATLEYGIKLNENNKIDIAKIKNVPAFFLGLSKDELISMVNNISDSDSEGGVDKNILRKIWKSLKEQGGNIKSSLNIAENQNLSLNMEKFNELISFLESKL